MTAMNEHLNRLDEVSIDISNEDNSSEHRSNSVSGIDSSISDSHGASPGRESSEAEIIASQVSKQVFWLKMTVLFVLVAAAVLVAVAIYLSTIRNEISTFETAFEDHALKVFDTFKFNIERKLGAIDSLGVAITSLAVDTGAVWPEFTIPDFEFRAANARELAEAASIAFFPIITSAVRDKWENYASLNLQWVADSETFQGAGLAARKLRDGDHRKLVEPTVTDGISEQIFINKDGINKVVENRDLYLPVWQHSPIVRSFVNYDVFSDPNFIDDVNATIRSEGAVIGRLWALHSANSVYDEIFDVWSKDSGIEAGDPITKVFYPVFDSLDADHAMVGVLASVIDWGTYFQQVLPPHAEGVICVLSNGCGDTLTYRIDGELAVFLGLGDHHDMSYNDLGREIHFRDLIQSDDRRIERFTGVSLNSEYCSYTLSVYPSQTLEDDFVTSKALIYTICVIVIFLFTGIVFLAYDYIVERRQKLVMKRAVQSRAIVSSLFPAAVRDRLFKNDDSTQSKTNPEGPSKGFKKKSEPTKLRLKSFLHDNPAEEKSKPSHELRPIADLFPHTTVMFADIAGFTAWSSERDPAHVFTLLQTVYHAFDRIAKKRGVFKVETIGDCYVAVTGLPDPQDDHALRMAKFSNECMKKMVELVLKLKPTLGEDTGDLCMRFGLHSGPVTAGVLRGEKSRFQLFGNTVNTAARMEHTGQRNKIQVTQETADLITEAGKGHWIYQRIDDIAARGGIQTYWVEPQSSAQEAKLKNSATTRIAAKSGGTVDNSQRLIDWNVDILKRLLKRVVAHRQSKGAAKNTGGGNFTVKTKDGHTVRDEIVDIIELPHFDKNTTKADPDTVKLSDAVEEQLRDYVTKIESMYHDNPFHSFKHASNVCTNANKMLCSIVDTDLFQQTSDPLTQFAVVFSALIHDVDHAGVTNMQLIKEKPHIAALYRNKSVAEQNSIDLAWNLLMDPAYEDLQDTIFSNHMEFTRFRNLVVNVVMATDIFDKELNAERNARWAAAFEDLGEIIDDTPEAEMTKQAESNLKATVIVEHVMQVADIMHTMQHFHSYQRWNERLFEEMYAAYDSGRTRRDPSVDWYEGEIWFFDNCVIPLAQKIKDCGVFGVQGDDCLKNAIDNKKEWTVKGSEIVRQSIAKFVQKPEPALGDAAEEKEETEEETKEQQKEQQKDAPKEQLKENKDKHMIEWNLDLFKRMLRQVLAHRIASGTEPLENLQGIAVVKEGGTVRDELARSVHFPMFDKKETNTKLDPDTIELSKSVEDQLRDYITFIASMYRDNQFHNFKHASNVCMSANKFLQRIVDEKLQSQAQHPLTQFAIAFSALIHDVDHTGVTNAELIKEKPRVGALYNNLSVAEQNSVDLAWTVLMDADYTELQRAIYSSQEELVRFRKIVVNSVMATDIFDVDLINNRNQRWEEAFNNIQGEDDTSVPDDIQDLRATIVFEHVMQASDIAHTMQHFHSYKRWNERLFQEMYAAFKAGRSERDPSKDWFEGEIKFFDQYVIPLAKKLKSSGVFGVAGDDVLSCAQSNRKDWVVNGVAIVQELVKKAKESSGPSHR